ncbi:MAG: PDDEXK nuclease domain-containing protein [Lachnospiraceae bacterium]|nr:PDDEXK nuclease domain-containing protein [Lachnospiraceae bacterium]
MNKKEITSIDQDFLKNVSEVLENARKNVKTAVNLSMVYAYYEIGRMIVEEEQHGQNRAAYGKQIVQELSNYLAEKFGKGFSTTNLKQMRQFYIIYSQDQISQTLSDQFENLPAVNTGRKFYLSWSHYLKLMRIDNADERHFYEIESVRNDWSLSELKRQYDSSLYERLALSTNKDKVYRLALEGQKVETAKDAVKDPYVLEFLGLKELPEYSESELESRIIDNLQQFLLELGTGFAFIGRQVRFTFDEEHFMVDLVFYNRLLRCFVLFDLKIGELKHQDIGQMQMYVHYYDRKVSAESKQRLPFMNRICMPLT